MGTGVGETVGEVVGSEDVGEIVGEAVGCDAVGAAVGDADGSVVVGDTVGEVFGAEDVGDVIGLVVGLTVKPQHVARHTKRISELAHNPWSRSAWQLPAVSGPTQLGDLVGETVGSDVLGVLLGTKVGFDEVGEAVVAAESELQMRDAMSSTRVPS